MVGQKDTRTKKSLHQKVQKQGAEKENGNGNVPSLWRSGLISVSELKKEVGSYPTDELKSILQKLLGFTAENLSRLAIVVQELENRGEDLSSIRMGLLPILRQIAAGELLSDIVVLYAGQPAMLKEIGKLPMDMQRKIAIGEMEYTPEPKQKAVTYEIAQPRRVNLLAGADKKAKGVVDDDDEDDGTPAPTQSRQETITGIATVAGARDVAEMAFDLIKNRADKDMVLMYLFNLLTESAAVSGGLAREMKAFQPQVVRSRSELVSGGY